MPDVHAKFSPSAAEQYINCPPSLKLCEQADIDGGSEYAAEGTEAHALCEYLLLEALGRHSEDPRPKLTKYTAEMQECAEGYRDMVLEIYQPNDFISVEQRVYFDEYVPGGFGTSDCIVIGNDQMHIIDYKHGVGVKVSAENNAQLKCYTLGAYLAFCPLYDIADITLIIYQPRINNFSKWTLKTEELLEWAENVLRPRAELALKGCGDFNCGSWCKFCKAKAVCRKLAETMTELAKYEFSEPAMLNENEINDVLLKADQLTSWVKAVKDYALQRALSGYSWKDWKVIEGQSRRKYTDENKVAEVLKAAGYDPYEQSVLGITAMEKLIGKKKFNELLNDLVVKPKGEPKLVSRQDKGEEIDIWEETE